MTDEIKFRNGAQEGSLIVEIKLNTLSYPVEYLGLEVEVEGAVGLTVGEIQMRAVESAAKGLAEYAKNLRAEFQKRPQ